jgi:hypothetical protein
MKLQSGTTTSTASKDTAEAVEEAAVEAGAAGDESVEGTAEE